MADKRKRSKYQLKLRARVAAANKLGGTFHSTNKDGKRLPFAMPVLLAMKEKRETIVTEEIDNAPRNDAFAVNSREEFENGTGNLTNDELLPEQEGWKNGYSVDKIFNYQ